MSADDEMTIHERFKYLRKVKKRCFDAGRQECGHLLDGMEAVTGLHRDSLFWLMRGDLKRRQRIPALGRATGTQTPICMFRNLQVR